MKFGISLQLEDQVTITGLFKMKKLLLYLDLVLLNLLGKELQLLWQKIALIQGTIIL